MSYVIATCIITYEDELQEVKVIAPGSNNPDSNYVIRMGRLSVQVTPKLWERFLARVGAVGGDHMRWILELIAGHDCEQHYLPASSDGPELRWHTVQSDNDPDSAHCGEAVFYPDTCPICMARRCLEQITTKDGQLT